MQSSIKDVQTVLVFDNRALRIFANEELSFSVPKNRNRRKIAAFSNRKVQNRKKFYSRKRRRIARKIAKTSQQFMGPGIKIAACPHFQDRSVFGTQKTLRSPKCKCSQ